MGPSLQERNQGAGEGPRKGNGGVEGSREQVLLGAAEGGVYVFFFFSSFFSLEKRGLEEVFIMIYTYLKVELQQGGDWPVFLGSK